MSINSELARLIRQRAHGRCEYCRLPQAVFPISFQIDHVIAEQHSGQTVSSNLALACPHCNLHKGPNIAGVDPVSGELVRLFHPRVDVWIDHFFYERARVQGLSPIGRATVQVLSMNAKDFLRLRAELLTEDIFETI